MKENKVTIMGKGFIIGATMIVPGVSGGTMAMILGIYDRLISAVSSFRKSPRDNFGFLSLFGISAGVGLILFSAPMSWLLDNYKIPTLYFFIGAVVGGIPLMQKKSGIERVDINAVLYLLIGALLVTMLSKLPQNLFGNTQVSGSTGWLMYVAAGIVSAIALILPGISFSHFLLILGLYEQLLLAVRSLELAFLLPLACGVLLGIILFSKILQYVMEKYPKTIYLLILGFIIGSVAEIFPGIPLGMELFVCATTGLGGFFATYRKKV